MWAVSCAVWALGTKPSSGRAEVPLHQRAMSSPTISPFSSSFFSVKFFLLRLLLHQKWQGNLLNIVLEFTFIWHGFFEAHMARSGTDENQSRKFRVPVSTVRASAGFNFTWTLALLGCYTKQVSTEELGNKVSTGEACGMLTASSPMPLQFSCHLENGTLFPMRTHDAGPEHSTFKWLWLVVFSCLVLPEGLKRRACVPLA